VKNSRHLTLFLIPVLFITLAIVTKSARAFHSGGVGECDGCHSMHGSQEGVSVGFTGSYLLKGSDSTSTCLNCHQAVGDTGPTSYHVSTPDGEIPFGIPPKQLSPGGDFAWLKKTFTWYSDAVSPINFSQGDSHGHNIASLDFGYQPDNLKPIAPGGAYPSNFLGCTSCHDPHGKYRRDMSGAISTSGNPIIDSGSYHTSPIPDSQTSVGVYRMLGGSGYNSGRLTAGLAFTFSPPVAVAPADYNRSEAVSPTRVAYGSGMSEWCRNCHTSIHNGSNAFEHPSPGTLGADYTNYYNSYIKTGDLTGTVMSSYSSLVPFEVGTSNYPTLKGILTNTPTKGPDMGDGTPQVMCLSCHRAHASGWDSMTRWNTKTSQIESNGAYSQEASLYQPIGQGRSEAEALQAYYQTPAVKFDANQQSLCTKCHSSVPQ
jgi:hypothetical protein